MVCTDLNRTFIEPGYLVGPCQNGILRPRPAKACSGPALCDFLKSQYICQLDETVCLRLDGRTARQGRQACFGLAIWR